MGGKFSIRIIKFGQSEGFAKLFFKIAKVKFFGKLTFVFSVTEFLIIPIECYMISNILTFGMSRLPPKGKRSSGVTEPIIDYSDPQLLPSDDHLFYDPD